MPTTEVPAGDELFDTQAACEELGFKNRSSITYYVKAGTLTPHANVNGGRVFLRSEIERFAREVLGKGNDDSEATA